MIITLGKNVTKIKLRRFYSTIQVLGIESSCDDTSAAVVNDKGSILGEGHFSQSRFHVETGGVLPQVATDLHREHLKNVVDISMKQSLLEFKHLDAIAVTVKPGLILSLNAGLEYAKDLCTLYRKPLIPIHHMEAHALTGRLMESVKFPFLVFLISGGHCILSLVKSVDKFYTLGKTNDSSPGQVFDRIARRGKLKNLKQFRSMVGGAAIEAAALKGDPTIIPFTSRVLIDKSCDFSFSGIWTRALRYIETNEKIKNVEPDGVIPDIYDLCASFQWAVTRHLCQRLELAMRYLETKNWLKEDEKCLVVSGGVASNNFVRKALEFVCDNHGYRIVVPPPKLCTDNGVMVAWNAVEKLKENIPAVHPDDLDSVTAQFKCPLGENISEDVTDVLSRVSFKYLKLKNFIETVYKPQDISIKKENV